MLCKILRCKYHKKSPFHHHEDFCTYVGNNLCSLLTKSNFTVFISDCNVPFSFLYSLMASLAPPIPSALASFLSSLLPCGFAVGPSRLCEGRLGLWWVGHLLEAGALVGSEGDAEWAWKYHNVSTTQYQENEPTLISRAVQSDSAEAEKVN